ncbi:hypothetical protein [Rossellomorea sp. LjRoot5]|uniref:hypothetical protein n=1 Tax=Rossellomorea sp. LjRoot5 TaxID=3342331 RepID=UPI003ECD10F2
MLTTANVKIKGIRPLIFNLFTVESIPLKKEAKAGVAGNNPEEWKKSFSMTNENQLYLESRHIFGCLRAGGKFIPKSRSTLESDVSATLQVLSERVLLNRYLPSLEKVSKNPSDSVYIDVRPVTRRGVKNIRYRLATSPGWETEFSICWDSTLISPQQMESICIEAGAFAGLGDARKIGYGRFNVLQFNLSNSDEAIYA